VKTKGRIFVLLAFLVLAGMIVSPVLAGNNTYTPRGNLDFWKSTTRESFTGGSSYSYDAYSIGDRISLIQFTVDTGQRVDFTLYYGGNKTVSGSAENSVTSIGLCGFLPCPMTTATVTLNGISKSYTYGDIQPLFDFDIAGYGVDNTNQQTGFLVYDGQYGSSSSLSSQSNDLAVFFPVNNTGANLITRVDISGSQTFSLWIDHGKAKDVAAVVSTGMLETVNAWLSFIYGVTGFLKDFLIGLFTWLKFLFIDNLMLTIALYLGVSMAYSAVSSKDIFTFYKKFFKFQQSMFKFMVDIWNTIFGLVSSIVGALGSAWPIVVGVGATAAILLLLSSILGS
jgi:hypothetical protein